MTLPDPFLAPADVAAIGGGPAGLMAAMAAAEQGVRVVLCERLDRPGVRLLATGGGRCNLTNRAGPEDFRAAFGQGGRFTGPALAAFGPEALLRLMADLGVPTHSPDGFHVYPASDSARDVHRALVRACEERGARLQTGITVTGLLLRDGALAGLETSRGPIPCPAVVLAAGGQSYAKLGGGQRGYELARAAGHTVNEPLPALVPLVAGTPAACAGVSLPDAGVRIDSGRTAPATSRGAVLFTHHGLSGPAVLDLSGEVSARLGRTTGVALRLNLLAERTAADWRRELEDLRRTAGRRTLLNGLDRDLPRSVAVLVLERAGLPADTPIARLTREHTDRLLAALTACPFTITGTAGFEQAMVTRGGVALEEVNPRTMASRRLAGLFLAGEVLDIDGPCGGYNLQWAFSSGRLAGQNAARHLAA